MPETVLRMSANCPPGVLSIPYDLRDNIDMNEMIETLEKLGLPASELKRIRAYYRDDPNGLREYVLYMRAMLDDRHEYLV